MKIRYESALSLLVHLGELRKRLIWVGVVLFISMIVGLFFASDLLDLIRNSAPIEVIWNVFSPWDVLRIYMQISFLLAFTITLPVTIHQLWAFVKPGLKEIERKAALKYFPFAMSLFTVGLVFGYFVVFRMALIFTSSLNYQLELQQTYGIAQYLSFLLSIVIPLSIVFELPVVIMFLTAIGIVNPTFLGRIRKYAYFILLIISMMITPPDVVSALLVSFPLILLYECSILLSKRVIRKQAAKQAAVEIV